MEEGEIFILILPVYQLAFPSTQDPERTFDYITISEYYDTLKAYVYKLIRAAHP